MSSSTYPVHVEARLDDRLSRWLWLVKWLLAIPHYLVLLVLWVAYAVLSVVAFVAILVTGRYPRAVFDFNVGVLRWSWRVAYYAYGALGTDQYPPFTFDDVPDYPAHLTIDYPAHLSRGLVLVKWWLLALPQYLVVGLFVGGGLWVGSTALNGDRGPEQGLGLIGVLVTVAAVVLLFTGRYPQSLFDLVLGLNRWVLRVAAYASLMTDVYPPFRLDMGGPEPVASVLDVSPGPGGGTAPTDVQAPPERMSPTQAPPAQQTPAGTAHGSNRSTGSVVMAVIGGLVVVLGLGGLGLGATAVAVNAAQRDGAGFLMSPTRTVGSPGYAVVSESLSWGTTSDDVPRALLGRVRVDATSSDGGPVFIGIARTSDVDGYLGQVSRSELTGLVDGKPAYRQRSGSAAPAAAPGRMRFWAASDQGLGTRSLRWRPSSGDWTIVLMRPTGAQGPVASVAAGATLPWVAPLGWTLAVGGLLVLVAGVVLLLAGVSGRPRRRQTTGPINPA